MHACAALQVMGATHVMDTTETRNAGGNIVHTRLISWTDSDDQVAPQRFEMLRWVHYLTNSTRREPFNFTPIAVNSISPAHLHVHPMGRTCS